MWHKSITALALCQLLPMAVQAQIGSTPATWPSDIDEMEDLMVLNSGYRARGFADVVTPCTNSPIGGFRVAAGFVRTAFHDVAAHNARRQTNGLDGSIAFELEGDHKVHNTGPGFNATLTWVSSFYNSKASISDLLALGVYSAVRSCGGPQIGVKVGRVDATSGASNDNLPDAKEDIATLSARFQQMGFSPQQMIQLVACGHTLGGVHIGPSPDVANNADPAAVRAQGVLPFDTTDAGFDNNVVTEYLDNSTKNPLVKGRSDLNSDKRVFEEVPGDNQVTIRKMADPDAFQATCQDVLQQMINRVPRGSSLSSPIAVYDVKPGQLNLNVINDGAALAFSGEVRLRTSTIGSPSSVVISYKDSKGATKEIEATKAGEASGFDDAFEFWGFSAEVESIVSFNVVCDSKTFNNNGKGFPVSDAAFVQVGSSSLSGSQLTVVVAVRANSKSTPQLTLSTISAPVYNSKLPTVVKSQLSTPKQVCSDASWTYWTVTTNIDSSKIASTKLEVSLNGKVVDAFRDITNFPSQATTPKCGSKSTTTSSMSSTSSSSSLSTSTKTSSTSLSSTLTSTSSTSLSSSSSTQTSSSSSLSSTSTKTSSESTSSGSTSSGSSSSSKTSSVSGSTSKTSSGTSSDKSSSTTTSSSSKKVDATSATTTSSSKDQKSSTTSGEKGASTTTSGEKGASTTKSGEKDTSTTSTKETTKYDVPNWTFWNPPPSKPTGPSYPDYPNGSDGGYDTTVVKSFTTYCPEPTKLVYNGHTYTVTKATTLTITDCPCTITVSGKGGKGGSPTGKPSLPSGGNGHKARGNAGDILSSIYRDQANVPAPSGGIDGGKGRTKDLEMSITITYVEPSYTAPSYVNPIGQFKPTATAGDNWNTWSTAKITATATATATPSDNWQPADVGKPADGSKPADNGKPVASATKSGHVAKYTGAANALARGEAVMMGAAAVVGVVALVL